MGSGSSKSSVKERNIQNSKRQKSENKNQQEGSKSEDNETDSLQNDGSQTRPRVNVNNNDESDHKAEVESIPKHNGKTQLKKEEDFKEQERKRLDTISKLKSGVNNQIANIRKCKEDKLNTFQVTNMSRQLQQFCFSNGLVSCLKLNSCRHCYKLNAY